MLRLFAFIYRYRVFGFFLLLEFISIWLLVSRNNFYNAYYFNSSNYLAGQVASLTGNVSNYVSLRNINEDLAAENALLRAELAKVVLNRQEKDSIKFDLYVIPGRIVSNDFRRSENYITINRGTQDGVYPGMGVISNEGVVGVVNSSSGQFATIISLLHRQLMVSAQIKKTKTLCTVQWDAHSPLHSDLLYVPRHIPLEVGDSVVTSGFNAVFPEGILVGIVSIVNLERESPFFNASIELANDFSSLSHVYVIDNKFRATQDSLTISYGSN